jgi:hypothetical protein
MLDNQLKLLKEISEWKLEAADEDSRRYFYYIDEVRMLENGERSIVIGRKGTGKTAICRYFETQTSYNKFCIKLSFKEFPFNLLYSLEDKNYTTPSQYISLWKYFIYNSVIRMMSSNEIVSQDFRDSVGQIYQANSGVGVGSLMETWIKKSFGVNILGIGGNYSLENESINIKDSWQDLIPIMENLIVSNIDSSRYYIVFDELDEDYRNYWDQTARDRYISLITSLFKAVSNVRRVFSVNECGVYPIIFLRDDIYELLSDPDKNKWEDHMIHLSWKKENLKQMIAFRIARSLQPSKKKIYFNQEWSKLFYNEEIPSGGNRKKRNNLFDYILSLTHARPRDFVRFLRDAARSAINQGHRKISIDTVRSVDGDYSRHFREELVNEISGVIPDINNLLSHLGASHKQRYRYSDFIKYIEEYQFLDDTNQTTKNLSSSSIAKILFHFSIVGNAPRINNRPIYKYQRGHLVINVSEPLVVHRGLVKTLGLH